ncbi:MAG TPA: tetratricopeptide repeat protein [Tepidisphaeraceae bacterium]|nr:tetratricopeptide repeat protein [Tepidisphaeraceae bacterium]
MITSTAGFMRTVGAALSVTIFLGLGSTGCGNSSGGNQNSGMFAVTNTKAVRDMGIRQYNAGEFTDAAGTFKNAIRQDPRDYQSYAYLGDCYRQMGQLQQAIQAYKSSLDTAGRSYQGREDTTFRARTLDGLAAAIAKSGEVEIDAAQQSAQAAGGGDGYFLMAKIHRNLGDADSALDAYNRASLLGPKDFFIQKDYGLFLEQIGQTQQAEKTLRKAYTLNSKDAEVVAALRRIGVVPGPSLYDQSALAKPPVPKGPIPPAREWQFGNPKNNSTGAASTPPAPTQTETVQAPRD